MNVKMQKAVTVLAILFAVLVSGVALMGVAPVPGTTPVQTSQPLYACDQTFTATGAWNTTVTLTTGAQTGKYFYVCHVDITELANAAVTGATGPAGVCTTTNLSNNLTWWGDNSTVTIGVMKQVLVLQLGATAIQTAAPGVAFTIACSGGQSTQSVRVNVSGYFAQ